MNEMYNRIDSLCQEKGINMTRMCRDAGIPRGNLTDLKNGRTAELSTKSLNKIALYFGVQFDYLLGNTDEKRPPESSEGPSDADIMFALFKGDQDISAEAYQEVKDFAEFVRQKYLKKKDE